MTPDVVFFATPAELRRWFRKNHNKASELWIGFYKKDSGLSALTYKQALDEALCFGWIDGIRKSVDTVSYTNRFTPRKPRSNWSTVNINRVEELIALGRMQPSGLVAFQAHQDHHSGVSPCEGGALELSAEYIRTFKTNKKAWRFFQDQPPWYRKTSGRWVMSAKKEETRLRRLATLIEDSSHGRIIKPLMRPEKHT